MPATKRLSSMIESIELDGLVGLTRAAFSAAVVRCGMRGAYAALAGVCTVSIGCSGVDTTCLDDTAADSPCAGASLVSAPHSDRSRPLSERLEALSADLSLGSRGSQ